MQMTNILSQNSRYEISKFVTTEMETGETKLKLVGNIYSWITSIVWLKFYHTEATQHINSQSYIRSWNFNFHNACIRSSFSITSLSIYSMNVWSLFSSLSIIFACFSTYICLFLYFVWPYVKYKIILIKEWQPVYLIIIMKSVSEKSESINFQFAIY